MKSAGVSRVTPLPVSNEPDLLKSARSLLEGLERNTITEKDARFFFSELTKKLEAEAGKFGSWKESHRADLFKALADLRGYGYKANLPKDLQERPVETGAMQIWRLAQRALGIDDRV